MSETGSVRPIEPLTDDIGKFLGSIGLDDSVWNGSKGVLGRPYVSTLQSTNHGITLEDVKRLRSLYIDVKRSLYTDATRKQLGTELETQMKLQKQLENNTLQIEHKISVLRKKMNSTEVRKGDLADMHGTLLKALHKSESELDSNKRAGEAIRRKILQTRVDITENETGFIRRFAVMRKIFAETATWAEVSRHFSNDNDLIEQAKYSDQKSKDLWAKVLQAKRFYVDAKMGLANLYQVESSLKYILENLEEAMKSQKGIPSENTSSLPSQVGVEYRLGYVRQLWSVVDSAFKAALPYIAHTSLRDENGTIVLGKPPSLSRASSEAEPKEKDYGTFVKTAAVLPNFSKIELAHPLSKTSRIASLHKAAAAAYKVINKIYDSQEVWINEAVAELKEREQEERALNDDLVDMWEKLLAIDTEHM